MNGRRLLPAFVAALLVSAMLFWFMQALIRAREDAAPVPPPVSLVERVTAVEEPAPPPPPPPERRPAPEPLAPRPQAAALSIAPVEFSAAVTRLPAVSPQLSIAGRLQTTGVPTGVAGGNALAAFAGGEEGFDGDELVPISSARPRYPRSAAERGIEGWVEVIFVVTGSGRVRDVRVLDASPRGLFEDAAVAAMERWLYEPYYADGKPVTREATQLFRFRQEDVQELYLWDD